MATPKSAFVPHKNVPRSPRLEMAVADYSGIQAPPGITYENYFFWYPTTKFKDQNGNNAPINGLAPDGNGEGTRRLLPTNSYGANLTRPAARMTLYYREVTATSRSGQGPNAEKFYGIRTDVWNPWLELRARVNAVGLVIDGRAQLLKSRSKKERNMEYESRNSKDRRDAVKAIRDRPESF